ncbi:selenium cofactor biosynthesis protein YqeC [Acetobacterium bakii]|uniref:Selenium-dependent hydroxylase accessory protein YqeC n=1 Tax=Acetobacterium bakii TaxID=52689 RepID=A0A0L6U403_9FIRM|nr:selenium cofactor biosynthesis protein YqeC [Acetobacterium bakii]KNZ43241.1 hypothetical protein AKG39_02020 [Acetobacterium bakii]
MNLIKDFNIQEDDVVTITGGGGKTSLMFAIGKELSAKEMTHVLTTTAKICIADVPKNQCMISKDIEAVLNQIKKDPKREWIIGKEIVAGMKISGFSDNELDYLKDTLGSLVILNEGDGSKRKPYKFYNDYEPIIPKLTTKIIHVIGAEVLFQKIDEAFFHRSELYGDTEAIFDEGVFKKVMENFIENKLDTMLEKTTPRILFINKADGDHLENAKTMGEIGRLLFDQCFIGSLKEEWVKRC